MSIIDEKGRLFGRVNLLDLVVLLAIVAVIGRFGYKSYVGTQAVPAGEDKTIEITLRFGAVADPTLEAVTVGTRLHHSKTNAFMGTVVEVRREPALVVYNSEDGRVYEVQSKNRWDYYVVLRGPGRVTENGITLAGLEMKIGRTEYVKTQLWAGYGVTWRINTDPPQR